MNKYTKYQMAGELDTTVSAKLLYLMLLDTVDAEGQIILPQRRVSEALGITRGTVSRSFRRLERTGAVQIVSTYNEYGGQMPNKYYVVEG
jgi:DNA-binding Lrp family transcriptional regulator